MAERNKRKTRTGVVISNGGDKTVVVNVQRQMAHAKYGKIVRSNKKYHAHDEGNECSVGDRVVMMETRPLAKTKRWRVTGILAKAK